MSVSVGKVASSSFKAVNDITNVTTSIRYFMLPGMYTKDFILVS